MMSMRRQEQVGLVPAGDQLRPSEGDDEIYECSEVVVGNRAEFEDEPNCTRAGEYGKTRRDDAATRRRDDATT